MVLFSKPIDTNSNNKRPSQAAAAGHSDKKQRSALASALGKRAASVDLAYEALQKVQCRHAGAHKELRDLVDETEITIYEGFGGAKRTCKFWAWLQEATSLRASCYYYLPDVEEPLDVHELKNKNRWSQLSVSKLEGGSQHAEFVSMLEPIVRAGCVFELRSPPSSSESSSSESDSDSDPD